MVQTFDRTGIAGTVGAMTTYYEIRPTDETYRAALAGLSDAELIAMGALIDDEAPADKVRRTYHRMDRTGKVTKSSVRRMAAYVSN